LRQKIPGYGTPSKFAPTAEKFDLSLPCQVAQHTNGWESLLGLCPCEKPDFLAARSGKENARSRQWEAWLRRQVAVPTSSVNVPSTLFLVLPLSVYISHPRAQNLALLSHSFHAPISHKLPQPSPPPPSRVIHPTADGSKHEGEYKDGKPVGWGVFTWLNGQRYEGEWLDGKPHGRGIFTWRDGKRYEGTTVDGMQVGKGIFHWPS
jgi:hypothetical protein